MRREEISKFECGLCLNLRVVHCRGPTQPLCGCMWRINVVDNPALQTQKLLHCTGISCGAAYGKGFPGMPPKQGQQKGISVCVECRASVLGDLQRPGHLDSAVLPVTYLKLFTWESFGAQVSPIKVLVVDSQRHLCLERTKSALFGYPAWTTTKKQNDEGDSDSWRLWGLELWVKGETGWSHGSPVKLLVLITGCHNQDVK